MLRIAPGAALAMARRANSVLHRNVPFSTMSTTLRHALADIFTACDGKLPAALLIKTSAGPNSRSIWSNVAATAPRRARQARPQ